MPSTSHKLGPGWQSLPHYWQAYNEATTIISALWKHPIYGASREYNQNGVRHCRRRYMDRFGFENIQHAIAVATKVILRDKYGEWPVSAQPSEIAGIGRARQREMRRGQCEAAEASNAAVGD